jgi:V/A-type H+-transporting ATPase subunit E
MTKTLGDITSELTSKVLSPAKAEAEQILREARGEAEKIVAAAQDEASRIKEAAGREAERVLKQMEVDLNAAARNFILLLEERLEKAIVQQTVEKEIRTALEDRDFLWRIMESVVREFTRLYGKQSRIEILLPEKDKAELEKWFMKKFHEAGMSLPAIYLTEKVSFGFKLGIEDTGKHFNFGVGLVEAFREFCSPRFRKYFFAGEKG